MVLKACQVKGKACLNVYEKFVSESGKEQEVKFEFYILFGQCLGDKVIELKGVIKKYGDCIIFEYFNFEIFCNVVVGIIGFNGVGKLMFFWIIMGKEVLDVGEVVIGDIVDLFYVD